MAPDRVELTWTDLSTQEAWFGIKRRRLGEASFASVGTASANATGFGDAAVVSGERYEYVVEAVGVGGVALASPSVSAAVPPHSPTGLSASATSQVRMVLSWSDRSSGRASFKVERRALGGGAFAQIDVAPVGATSYVDGSPSPATTYEYRVLATLNGIDSTPSVAATATTRSNPTLVSSQGTTIEALSTSTISFQVTASDPDGDLVSLRLVNHLPGVLFEPVWRASGPLTRTLRWRVPHDFAGPWRLVFEANDDAASTQVTRLVVTIVVRAHHLNGDEVSPYAVGDVTGDSVPDLVVVAPFADVGGRADVGAVYVWAGGASPSAAPTAILTVPGAAASDQLGRVSSILLEDVNGDGKRDIIVGARHADTSASDAGAVYVWAGGGTLSGAVAPTAVLTVPGAAASDAMPFSLGSLKVANVTGDAWPDIIAAAPNADIGGVVDTGAIYVWAGGPGLATGGPTAKLYVPGAAAGDRLGLANGQALHLGDVTGDGVLDVISGSELVDVGGVTEVGALYVWKGGATLTGSVAPHASLTVSTATAGDNLTFSSVQGVHLGDVTGDGLLDIVVGARRADIGGSVDAGAVYLWKGGATLTGAVAPTARLSDTTAGDILCHVSGQGFFLVDVTGDGTLDVVTASLNSDLPTLNEGAIHVWAGGAGLTGNPAYTARLWVSTAAFNDWLGDMGIVEQREGVLFGDVDGDGVLDIVAGSRAATVGGLANVGRIYVWRGGSAMVGQRQPTATLSVPGAASEDRLGEASGHAILLADVTGDGLLDIVAGASGADAAGADSGAVYVWQGGAALVGARSPSATLTIPQATPGDRLSAAAGQGLRTDDVTGDGVLDVIVGARYADDGAAVDAGAVLVWAGGAGLSGAPAPRATLRVPGANAALGLGFCAGQGIQVADVTGDGRLDLVVGAEQADLAGAATAGAVYVWSGGAGLSAAPAPLASLRSATPAAGDRLGRAGGEGVILRDLTGDGALDVIAAASAADIGGVVDTGALHLWAGGAALTGTPAGTALSVPGAATGDGLGRGQ